MMLVIGTAALYVLGMAGSDCVNVRRETRRPNEALTFHVTTLCRVRARTDCDVEAGTTCLALTPCQARSGLARRDASDSPQHAQQPLTASSH